MHAIKHSYRSGLVILLFLATSIMLQAQNPLERKVSLNMKNTRIAEVLKEIESKGNLTFSYNPEQIRDDKFIDASYNSKPVRFVLDRIFKGWVDYRAKGNYIILQPTKNPPVPEPKFQKVRISGYVLDGSTGSYLNGVSIYDTIAFYSAISDQNGHFEMELSENSNALYLLVKKQGFEDTSYFIPKDGFQSVELVLHPEHKWSIPDTILQIDSISGDSLVVRDSAQMARDWKAEIKQDFKEIGILLNEKLRFNSININDTFFRKFQFSLVPGISTNRMLAGNVINDYSFNLIGGYSKGVNVLEIGGIFNLDEGDVRYFQGASVFNVVGGNVKGAQTAGVFNVNGGRVNGFQGAGIFNINEGGIVGAQGAGIFNISTGHVQGLQAAGIFNIGDSLNHGVQAAGIFNMNTLEIYGGQAAGIFNSANRIHGFQAAGIFNEAEEIDGIQAAAIFNRAGYVKGVQIGLLNFSDSIRGLPIGLFSFVKKGYHKWEMGSDELFYTRTSFRSGSHWFHNIIQAGMDPRTVQGGDPLWMVGYGLGFSIPIRRSYLDFDLTASQVMKGKPELYWSTLGQFYFGADFHLFGKVSLAAGATANFFFVDENHPDFGESFNPLYDGTLANVALDAPYRAQGWFGGKVALRFF